MPPAPEFPFEEILILGRRRMAGELILHDSRVLGVYRFFQWLLLVEIQMSFGFG